MNNTKKYWKGYEELKQTPEFVKLRDNEFAEELPAETLLGDESIIDASTNRRDFLKVLGFSVTAATLASCETPVNRSIPYLNKPEEVTPGVANFYAGTYWDGNDFSSLLIKTREGRPIKVDGNELCPITGGGSHARVQASVLSLYDSARIAGPLMNGASAEWSAVDTEIKSKLAALAQRGGAIRILSSTIISPSFKKALELFSTSYPNVELIQYDAVSYDGISKAHELTHGSAIIPTYRFDNADYVLSLDCDFLANWVSPIEHASQYASKRKLNKEEKKMSRHVQIESLLSLTGSNADFRMAVKPSDLGLAAAYILNKLNGTAAGAKAPEGKESSLNQIVSELQKYNGKAIVVSGSNDPAVQQVVNAINISLNSYGNTILTSIPDYTRSGSPEKVMNLISEMKQGKVAALFIHNVNPVYTLPNGEDFKEALSKVDLSVSFADRVDETAAACKIITPDNHYLESWADFNPRLGVYSFGQPTIQPLFKTRQAIEGFLNWANAPSSAHDYIQSVWESSMYPNMGITAGFASFWNKSLHDGVINVTSVGTEISPITYDISLALSSISKSASKAADYQVVVYQSTGMGNGNQANNPWLQEFPDPITRLTWDNYVLMNPDEMIEKGFNVLNGQEQKADVIDITVGSVKLTLPVSAQPGIPKGVLGIAMGYGRTAAGKTGDNIGVNAFKFTQFEGGVLSNYSVGATISDSVSKYHLAATQTHHTMMGRSIVKETTLEEYRKDSKAGNPDVLFATNLPHLGKDGKAKADEINLWEDFENKNHFWNMAIDLNACIGCGSCIISCTAENNVPVVGKDEVRRSREMHWMRIDRYYSSDMTDEKAEAEGVGGIDKFLKMEVPSASDSVEVVFQPVMCQHCNHAPCETVCPVLATTHSLEGLNQMTYNRCIGTRYCANNCPYKVRRFNWFRYNENPDFAFNMYEDLGKMVLNPDVTVRSRGVMEKCSMCVQRIQAGKLSAKKDGVRPKDGSIKTACQQSCPTNAITFGDFNDASSKIREAWNNERKYQLLEEVGVQPSVFYLTKVRNKISNLA